MIGQDSIASFSTFATAGEQARSGLVSRGSGMKAHQVVNPLNRQANVMMSRSRLNLHPMACLNPKTLMREYSRKAASSPAGRRGGLIKAKKGVAFLWPRVACKGEPCY